MPRKYLALTMSFFSRPRHSMAVSRRPCCGLERNGMVGAWHGRGVVRVNQIRPHCVNQMRKTYSKTLAARHGRGTAWARHAMCESAFTVENCTLCTAHVVLAPHTRINSDVWLRDGDECVPLTSSKLRTTVSQDVANDQRELP